MEIVQSSVVRARGARWTVVDVRAYERCRLLTLAGIGAANAGIMHRLLTPFDSVECVRHRHTLRRVSRSGWRRHFCALASADRPPGSLISLDDTRWTPYPHQIEPALAVIRGLGSRLLLADEVGLGKTIEAGVVIAELRARGASDRVLIITPAGLRDQWRHELRDRLGIDALVVDTASAKHSQVTRSVGVSAWQATPVAVTSVDYIKRTDVLAAAAECRWDVVVVDEAHGIAGDSDRRAAVATLAARAGVVLFLTATPHSGDRRAFRSLCEIGAIHGDQLLVFRRTRADVGIGTRRRVHRLDVRPSVEERRMHRQLAEFGLLARRTRGRHPDVVVGLSVLQKRAYSSPRSLELTVARRLATLDARSCHGPQQIELLLDDGGGESTPEDAAPEWPKDLGLFNVRDEHTALVRLRDAARAATATETKVWALRRLIARIQQPVIVFTEYRDTLLHLQQSLPCASVALHGGLSRSARLTVLESFASGKVPVLLATDAAGEGLNLQDACAVVVNLELPWTPTQLEQRIGRVDRIGQRRTVHVFHMVVRDTESPLWAQLAARVDQMQSDVGGPNPLGAADRGRGAINDTDDGMAPLRLSQPQLTDDARGEVEGILSRRLWRRLSTSSNADALDRHVRTAGQRSGHSVGEARGALMAHAQRWQTRRMLSGQLVTLWRVIAARTDGIVTGSRLVPVLVPMPLAKRATTVDVGFHLSSCRAAIQAAIHEATRSWRDAVLAAHLGWARERARRVEEILARPDPASPAELQFGLFDRREQRAERAMLAAERSQRRSVFYTRGDLGTCGDISFHEPELLLVLSP